MSIRRISAAAVVVAALAAGLGLAAPASAATPTAGAPVLTGPASIMVGSTATFTVAFVPADACTAVLFDIEQTGGTFGKFGSTVTVFTPDANGNSTASATTDPLGTASTYTVKAVLQGCAGGKEGVSAQLIVSNVTTYNTATVVLVSPTSVVAGPSAAVTVSATVSEVGGTTVPTGSVSFSTPSGPLGTATLDSTGTATLSNIGGWGQAGTVTITAFYAPAASDATDNPSQGQASVQVTAPTLSRTTLTVLATPSSFVAGESTTLTAVVASASGGPVPTGTVTFLVSGASVGTAPLDSTGTASLPVSSWAAGSYVISASYGGDPANNGTTGVDPVAVTVNPVPAGVPTTTTVTAAPDPILIGQLATLTATVAQRGAAPAPIGDQVIFSVDGNPAGEAPVEAVNGQLVATLSTGGWVEGNDVVGASFLGDIANEPSQGQVTVSVTGASTIGITTSADPSTFGQTVTFTAQVAAVPPATDTPSGSVTFTALEAGSTQPLALCTNVTVSPSSSASCSTSSLDPGTYTVTAAYGSDPNFATSSAALIQSVNPVPVTVTVDGSMSYGSASPSFSYTTSVALGQGVNLAPSCTTVDGGNPIVASSPLPAGVHAIDGSSCSGASAPVGYSLTYTGGTFTVSPTPVTVRVSGSMVYGAPSPTFTYTTSLPLAPGVTLAPSCGTVSGGQPINASLAAGTYLLDSSSCSVPNAPSGYTVSLSGGQLVVAPADVTVTVSGTEVAGSNSATLTYTANPGVTLTGTLACRTIDANTPIALAGVGTHTILGASCSGLSAANYTVSYVGAGNGFVVTAPPSCVLIFTSGPNVTAMTGTYRGNYEVKNGATLYLDGGTITGNVTVDPTGSFLARRGTVQGNVQSNGGPVSLQGTTVDGNVQTHNGALALGAGTLIAGNVQANGGADVCVLGNQQEGGVQVGGNLQIQSLAPTLATVNVCYTTVGGNLQYQNNAAPVAIGGGPSCLGDTVGGNLQVQGNSARVTIGGVGYGNSARGNVLVQGNTGGGALTANRAGGNVELQNNRPGIVGSGNTATGQNTGNRTA